MEVGKEGEKYYLVNVASGLYPQTIAAGSDKTTDVGAKNPSLNFSWKQHAEITSTSNAQYNIFFGQENNGQINVEANGNVNYWYGNNAHHYLWKVDKTDAEILALVNDWAKSQNLKANANATKLQVIEGVTQIISPTEFAAPNVVNAAIDAVKTYDDATVPTLEQAQALYNNYTIVNNYVNQAKRMAVSWMLSTFSRASMEPLFFRSTMQVLIMSSSILVQLQVPMAF